MFKKNVYIGLMLVFLLCILIMILCYLFSGRIVSNMLSNSSDSLIACGKFGDKQLRIKQKDLYSVKVGYQGINYWNGDAMRVHETKGCGDQFSAAIFYLKWPEMVAAKGFDRSSKQFNDITIGLHQRSSGSKTFRNKESYDYSEMLNIMLNVGNDAKEPQINNAKNNAKKKFNKKLSLYQMDFINSDNDRYTDTARRELYWQEIEGKVSLLINCRYFKNAETHCEFWSHVPNYGFYTSNLQIEFHSELLPYWQQIRHDSLKLIDSFVSNS